MLISNQQKMNKQAEKGKYLKFYFILGEREMTFHLFIQRVIIKIFES